MNIKKPKDLTKHQNNAAIKIHKLPEERMRELGFTDRVKTEWYLCKKLDKHFTFNITINKDMSDWEICILDEMFLQHYDFQSILEDNPTLEFALKIQEKVEDIMSYLQNNGVISGHERYDYI